MRVFNTLTRQLEEFKPIEDKIVRLYTCGPTVYDFPHIGNWRTFVFDDVLRRTLEYNGFKVNHVMNATDVGHLTGDNIGNADIGEDRIEKAAKRENKTAWDIANFYIADFKRGLKLLNIEFPTHFVRATDHIAEQIDLIKKLLDKGLAYVTETGVFYDVTKFPDYGKLGGQKLIDKRVATREELVEDKTKHHPADFALWKFSKPEYHRQMEWKSPWGTGFPGWHIECSAISMKYLGDTLDIHTGGVDHIAIHHTNEIAQSEGATGKKFSDYWLHGEFLTVNGGRMGKSLGNAYTLQDIIKKELDPLALRYFYFGAHYRSKQNFTWEGLNAAAEGLKNMKEMVIALRIQTQRTTLSEEKLKQLDAFRSRFKESLSNDFQIPQALATAWEMLKSNIPSPDKLDLMLDFDRVLGLRLDEAVEQPIPQEVTDLAKLRDEARKNKDFQKSDEIRKQIEEKGYRVEDTTGGTIVKK